MSMLSVYVKGWHESADAISELVQGLTDEQWATATDLPGWSVQDTLAHLAHLEAVLSGTALRTVFHMNSGDLNRRHAHLGTTTAEWLSRDSEVVRAFVADPLTFEAKAAKLFGLVEASRLLGRPRRLARDLPLLIQIGSEDTLGGPRSVELLARAYRERGGLSDVTVRVYEGARHEIYNETNREEVVADLLAWLGERLLAAPSAA